MIGTALLTKLYKDDLPSVELVSKEDLNRIIGREGDHLGAYDPKNKKTYVRKDIHNALPGYLWENIKSRFNYNKSRALNAVHNYVKTHEGVHKFLDKYGISNKLDELTEESYTEKLTLKKLKLNGSKDGLNVAKIINEDQALRGDLTAQYAMEGI